MKRRKRYITIACDELLYEVEDGTHEKLRAGQWFKVKRKLSKNDYAQVMRFTVAAEDDDHSALIESSDEILELLARKVVDWNLTDLDADEDNVLLPNPPTAETLEGLDFVDDTLELFTLYLEAIFPSKN